MDKNGPIGVAVVDDNVNIGESLERWFRHDAGYRFLGAFTSAEAALESMAESQPHVVLVDVDMPGTDTFALLARIVAELPGTRAVMLSGHVQPEYIERALDGGAAGYIVKDETIPTIMGLMRQALAGEIVLSPTAQDALIRDRS